MTEQVRLQPKDLGPRTEDTPFTPASAEDLKQAIVDSGYWNQYELEKDTVTKIEWNDDRVKKLFDNYKDGERDFFWSSYTDQKGETVRRLETEMKIVKAQVFYSPNPRETSVLKQYLAFASLRKNMAGQSEYTLSGIVPKKEESSISGKIKSFFEGNTRKSESPLLTLKRELSEELQLQPDTYRISGGPKHSHDEGYSFNAPGLWTRYKFTDYTVELLPQGYKDTYFEVGKTEQSAEGWKKIAVNVFRWNKLMGSR